MAKGIDNFNPFGGDTFVGVGDFTGTQEEPEVGVMGADNEEISAETVQLANSLGMQSEMAALQDGDSSAITTRLAQELNRVTDIVNRAMAMNIEQQIDLGAIERAVNSSPPDPVALENALKEIDNANQVEARVVNQELTNGIVGGSAAMAGLGAMATTIGGIAGSESIDPRIAALGNEVQQANQGMKTIARGMNNLETNVAGGISNNHSGLEEGKAEGAEAAPGQKKEVVVQDISSGVAMANTLGNVQLPTGLPNLGPGVGGHGLG